MATAEGREPDGRFAPGQSGNPETQWGPGNPPPRSPGRPKKDAWLGEVERMLDEDGRIPKALASRLVSIALKGNDRDALRALELLQAHTGGPPIKKAEITRVGTVQREIVLVDPSKMRRDPPPWPREVQEINDAEERAKQERDRRRGDALGQ